MKKTLVALAALAATSAFAQSTVSIDGIVNYGVAESVKKTATVGGWKGDRNVLNFKIVEDLGAGNNIGLTLQTRFNSATSGMNTSYVNSNTGAAGDNVFEQSKVTINSASYGQLALGRFTNAQGVADLHPFEDAAQTTGSNQAINGRHSGQFQYTTPSFGGAKFWALGARAASNVYLGGGSGAGYSSAWDLTKIAPGTAAGTNVSTNANPNAAHRDLKAFGVDYTNGALYVHANTMTDLTNTKSSKIGATYDLGFVKIYGSQYDQKDNIANLLGSAATYKLNSSGAIVADAAAVTTGAGAGLAAHKATEIAFKAPYGKFNFMYGRLSSNKDIGLGVNDGSTKVQKSAYGVTYDVSKRTQLMAFASNTKNGGDNGTLSSSGSGAVSAATTNTATLINGHTSFIGLQHSF